MELQADAQQVTPITVPTPLLPPPNDLYVSPQQYHLLLQQGIVLRNVRHKLFTQSLPPPDPGGKATHSFGSQVDLELSTDAGNTFRPMRAPASVTVSLEHRSTDADGTQTYDTEMLQLDIQGGDLPPNIMIRESPTLASLGSTAVTPVSDSASSATGFTAGARVSSAVVMAISSARTLARDRPSRNRQKGRLIGTADMVGDRGLGHAREARAGALGSHALHADPGAFEQQE